MPRYTLKLTLAADGDYESILDYTFERWGYQQFVTYRQVLREGFQELRKQPAIGKQYEGVPTGILGYRVGSHYVFYRLIQQEIQVIRILHGSMDFKRHFTGK